MAIKWTEELATGSSKIDYQHKILFTRINGLLTACYKGRGREEVGGVLRFLEDYVVTHFAAEEQCMMQYRYPGFADHKAQHLAFMKQLANLKNKIETEGAGLHIVVATNQLVVQWFLHHICMVDKELGTYLKEKTQRTKA